ncbi:MAG: DNA translocase FtsK 4TM domain-containing protein [Bacillota bacterium]|nr:DNA translocase FtsK 4TM domain-containing protein [Bacillota bacterium]
MAKKGRKKKKKLNKEMRTQIKGVLLLALAAFTYVGLINTAQTGGVGLFMNSALRTIAGNAAVIIPFFIAVLGLRMLLPAEKHNLKTRMIGILALFVLYTAWVHLDLIATQIPNISGSDWIRQSFRYGFSGEGGGVTGAAVAVSLRYLLGITGGRILLIALAVISGLVILNISIKRLLKGLINATDKIYMVIKSIITSLLRGMRKLLRGSKSRREKAALQKRAALNEQAGNALIQGGSEANGAVRADSAETAANARMEQITVSGYQSERQLEMARHTEQVGEKEDLPEKVVRSGKLKTDYKFPPIDLLSLPTVNGEKHYLKSSKDRARLLENTLLSFGVRAKVIHVQSGPTVTRFEVQPEAGVKVSKIISLSDDLALNLAAPLVRIEAPIPGKAALGIEVPNKVISLVYAREVIEESAFKASPSPLTIGLGKDITGIPVISDLTKMPHLLIAGSTGAGKSVCLNTLIMSILYKAGPDHVRFMMIDPKVVELSVYNGIPHLLMPVLTDPRKASLALRNMVREMGRRYDLFAKLGVRDIGAYNELSAEEEDLEQLPFIVVIIDELADLMLVSPGEVEDAIARLAQMSRASGIHLVVATQRPSVDVLTGIIKANITSRIAFTVSSQFDSRTILDMAGAEKLLGRGDMLFYPVGAVKPFRVQGAYVSEAEVKRITDFIKEQGLVDYEEGSAFMEPAEETEDDEMDALFAEAVDLVVRTGQASISLLQRRFRIGYTRAARLIDDLERRGVVGPFEGSKPREVLITQDQASIICEDFKNKNE